MPKVVRYLTIMAAAEYLGVCQNTLRSWDAAGKIPVHRHPINNYRLFRVTDLDAIIRQMDRPVPPKKRKPR